ncbi:unnamed protein product [Larinioides sclopetarius]|uniref:Uncharacterized protein n=1 Tax=Larinioides sclopetarius TaxID=280406 RepID=A0AAV2ATI4_9ARAC
MLRHRNERREYMQKYWDVETYSTESSFTHDDYNGLQIPPDDDMKKDTTKEYSFLKRRALSIEKEEKSVTSMPPFTIELSDTAPISRKDAHHKNLVTKRKNDKKQFNRQFKYDPALMLMGLGKKKQDSSHQHNKTLKQKRSIHESNPMYSNSDKQQERDTETKNIRNNTYSSEWKPIIKRSTEDQPFMTMIESRKPVVAYDKQNLSEYGMQSMLDSSSMRVKDYLNTDTSHDEEDISNSDNKPDRLDSEDEQTGSSNNAIFDYDLRKVSDANSKRSSNYDPALKYMGLGKKNSYYDPALKYMGLGKKSSSYDPALRYMGLGKRNSYYDPALKYMGLGKKSSSYDPALRYVDLGKRNSYYDPALKYMGLGKKSSNYDPALRYMGLGKKDSYYDPALKYMGLGKKSSSYDPALKYMGLGKRNSYYDPALKYMGLGKKSSNYDPALRYMGLGKKDSYYDPALKYMGLGKRSSGYDPALRYMSLGKRNSNYDPALKYMGLGKKSSSYDPGLKYMGLGKRSASFDPALKYMGLGKRGPSYDPALKYMGLGKRTSSYDPALKYMGLGKKSSSYDPALKYMGLGKKSSNYDPALQYMGLGKKSSNYDPALQYMGLGKKNSGYDPALKYMGLGKKSKNYDPALKYMGLGKKRSDYDHDKRGGNNQNSRKVSYDPALIYMGLGKRQTWSESFNHFSFHPSFNHGDVYKQAFDNARKMNSSPPNPKINNPETTAYIFSAPENATNSNSFDSLSKSADENNRVNDYRNEAISNDKKYYGYDSDSNFKGKDLESHPARRAYYDYPDPKLVQKLVNYFDSLRYQTGRYPTPTANDETSKNFDNSDHQEVGRNNNYEFLRNFQKKSAMYDPALRYMGLGKRNATDKPEFEIALSDHSGPNCENRCKYSTRKKRDVNSNEDRLSRITSPHFNLKVEPQDQFSTDTGLDDLVISSSNGGLMTLHENRRKRERDNRPKYNPGWIFIGLGKRSPEATVDSPKMIQVDQPNALLLKYYNLMEKIKDRLQKVKYDLIDKGYRNNEKWIAFHNTFTGASDLKEYPELYPLLEYELNNSPDLIADSGLHTPPLSVRPQWKLNIVPAYEKPSNPGK